MKTVILLLLTMAIPFPLCYFRMKEYDISLKKMLIIYAAFSTVGFIGALYGPPLVGIRDVGVKLYGLVLFDFIALFLMSKVVKVDVNKLGDFIAPPIMAVCASAKINCLMNNCCKGFVMFYNANEPVYFPSAILEMVVWFAFVALLLLLEKKRYIKGTLWPVLMIWFGIVRFLVDFLRESEWERKAYVLFLSGGQFWSLVTALCGIVLMIYALRCYWKRNPTIAEVIKVPLGIKVSKNC